MTTMFDNIRAVTFDCWGTLIYERDVAASRALRNDAIAAETGLSDEEAEKLQTDAWTAHVEAWTRHEQFGGPGAVSFIAERTGIDEAAQSRLLQVYENASLAVGVNMVPGADETLTTLIDAGLSTALVCDTGLTPGRIVMELLESHGLARLLDAFAFSDEIGVPKPNAAMFEAALDAIGGGPAVHIGDLRRTDVAGARGAGLGSVRFRGIYDDDSPHPEADMVIDDLRELPALLGL